MTSRRCAHCGAAFEPKPRGRKARCCSTRCARAANRATADGADPAVVRRAAPAPYEDHEVCRVLRDAVRRHPGTLEDISAGLARRGVERSASSLSAYQRGVQLPPDGMVLYALDQELGLPPGTLRAARASSPAPPPTPGPADPETASLQERIIQLTGARFDSYVVLLVRDVVHVDDLGRPAAIDVEMDLQAEDDDVHSYWVIESADTPGTWSRVRRPRNCTVGHQALVGEDRLATQLLLGRALRRGERRRIAFAVERRFSGPAAMFHRRCVPGNRVGHLEIHVHFARRPRSVRQSEWSIREAPSRGRPAALDGLTARMIRPAPAPGTYGVEWEV